MLEHSQQQLHYVELERNMTIWPVKTLSILYGYIKKCKTIIKTSAYIFISQNLQNLIEKRTMEKL